MDHKFNQINLIKKEFIVFSRYFDPVNAGREINILETYRHLGKRGWKTTIFTSKSTHTNNNVLPDTGTKDGIIIKRFKDSEYMFPFWIRNIDLRHKIICLHGIEYLPDIFIYLYILLLKVLGRKDFIVLFASHGLYSLRYQFDNGIIGSLKRGVDKVISKFLLNNIVDGFRAVSQWEADFMILSGIKKVIPIHNGLPEDALNNYGRDKKIIDKYGNYIIQIGRLDKSKNYEAAINAIYSIKNKKINLLIVGPVENLDYKKTLDQLIDRLDLQSKVYFLGSKTGDSKYRLLKNSVLFVQMSKSEGFGNTANEAMSQGCFCIVSANTALSEVIKNNINGFTVNPDDYQKLAKKIDFVLDKKNSKFVKRVRMHNKLSSRNRTWKHVSVDIEKFIIDTVKKWQNSTSATNFYEAVKIY